MLVWKAQIGKLIFPLTSSSQNLEGDSGIWEGFLPLSLLFNVVGGISADK